MYKYFAFISYSSKDVKWGKRIQKKLEGYRMPSTLCSQHGWSRKPMRPIFFAPTDIQPGELTVELQERMKASRHMIVICSPNSAQSKWVGREIEYFHSLGRPQNIHFFIVDGRHSGTEKTKCFNPVVETLGLSGVLGVNINEKISRWPWVNKERAYVQLITKLLGIEFDIIWQRHKRLIITRFISVFISTIIVFLFFLWYAIPINLTIRLLDEKHNLPPFEEGVLNIRGNELLVHSLDTTIQIPSLPGYLRGTKIHYTFTPVLYYETISSDIKITNFKKQLSEIQVKRNNEFACYSGQVLNEQLDPISGVTITIENQSAVTDTNGCYSINFPLTEQTVSKQVNATHSDYKSYIFTSYATFDRFILRH